VRAIADQVREAHGTGKGLRIRGAGTWLDAGRPVNVTDTLSLADHRGITEYVPGDLTLTARAGTPLADIVTATAAHGQWLPLDPWGGDAGTIGATISTGTAGPHSYAMGLPRDVVLGMEFVSGSGEVIRPGGRVVKNVAGFDLTRLIVGSWGTLGVITELTVRLRARPDQTETLAIAVAMEPLALNELALRLRALPFTPLASELVSARLASHLGIGSQSLLLCRVGGNARSLNGQLDALRAFGQINQLPDDVWNKLRALDSGMSATWRWSHQPSRFGETWTAVEKATSDLHAFAHGNPARGLVRVAARGEPAQLAKAANAFDGTTVFESFPAAAWPLIQSRNSADPISRSIREKFNPRRILNAGILGSSV
jgi:glycolate oxidase FAD binding subunit